MRKFLIPFVAAILAAASLSPAQIKSPLSIIIDGSAGIWRADVAPPATQPTTIVPLPAGAFNVDSDADLAKLQFQRQGFTYALKYGVEYHVKDSLWVNFPDVTLTAYGDASQSRPKIVWTGANLSYASILNVSNKAAKNVTVKNFIFDTANSGHVNAVALFGPLINSTVANCTFLHIENAITSDCSSGIVDGVTVDGCTVPAGMIRGYFLWIQGRNYKITRNVVTDDVGTQHVIRGTGDNIDIGAGNDLNCTHNSVIDWQGGDGCKVHDCIIRHGPIETGPIWSQDPAIYHVKNFEAYNVTLDNAGFVIRGGSDAVFIHDLLGTRDTWPLIQIGDGQWDANRTAGVITVQNLGGVKLSGGAVAVKQNIPCTLVQK